jgi:DNA-binding beta-propeller fold protein YncE
VAVAVEDDTLQNPGQVVFFDTNGQFLNSVTVGALPDMVVFTPDGRKVLTANEGEPSQDYTIDPEGTVSIIDITPGIASITNAQVTTVSFAAFNTDSVSLLAAGVRLYGPNATVAQDVEPEYITISPDNKTAYVTLQENNAIGVINLETGVATEIRALGVKTWDNTSLDVSDNLGGIYFNNWSVKGLYEPDGIAFFGDKYLITANEGDAREYTAFAEIVRLNSVAYKLDSVAFPHARYLKRNDLLGRLNVTTASGDTDGDGDFDEIHTLGGRSVSIWDAETGALVWDSGDDFERITATDPVYGSMFNASNSNNTFKNRSDDKGPEPEGVTVATLEGRQYAFVALERIGLFIL